MKKVFTTVTQIGIFSLLFLLAALLVFLTQTEAFKSNAQILSHAITFDLLLTLPLLYFAAIRKTSIPNITVVPVLLVCTVLGTNIIPVEHQDYLSLFKTWGLPIVELGFLTYLFFKIRKAVLLFKEKNRGTFDFYTSLKATCKEMLPAFAVMPVVTEVAVCYYGFLNWRRRSLMQNEFSYHKNSGTLTVMVAIILLVAVETVTLHHLLSPWSTLAAQIVTLLSIYSGIQLFGFLRSMPKRPIAIAGDALILRYGIMAEATIPLAQISAVELTSRDIEKTEHTRKLSPLGDLESHNVIIALREEYELSTLYGIKRKCRNIALFVDTPETFKARITAKSTL